MDHAARKNQTTVYPNAHKVQVAIDHRKTFLGQRNRGFQLRSAAKARLETVVTSQSQKFILKVYSD